MRTINDLTENELLALSEEELEQVIDRECMARGIPLLPPEPVPPMEPCIEYDVIAYSVAGYEFQHREDAEAVANLINGKPRAKYDFSYPRYSNDFIDWSVEDRVSVTEKPILSPAQRLATQGERDRYKAAKEAFDEKHEEYRKILGERSEVGAEVRDRWYAAHRKQREREQHRANFERYLHMADGERLVAYRFFEQAYSSALTDFPELRDEFAGVSHEEPAEA